uniref:Uncharacterized protein n=1 Tax=Oryza brachyantha TaxID=4533 RepID=J3NBN0_ORYBR
MMDIRRWQSLICGWRKTGRGRGGGVVGVARGCRGRQRHGGSFGEPLDWRGLMEVLEIGEEVCVGRARFGEDLAPPELVNFSHQGRQLGRSEEGGAVEAASWILCGGLRIPSGTRTAHCRAHHCWP